MDGATSTALENFPKVEIITFQNLGKRQIRICTRAGKEAVAPPKSCLLMIWQTAKRRSQLQTEHVITTWGTFVLSLCNLFIEYLVFICIDYFPEETTADSLWADKDTEHCLSVWLYCCVIQQAVNHRWIMRRQGPFSRCRQFQREVFLGINAKARKRRRKVFNLDGDIAQPNVQCR